MRRGLILRNVYDTKEFKRESVLSFLTHSTQKFSCQCAREWGDLRSKIDGMEERCMLLLYSYLSIYLSIYLWIYVGAQTSRAKISIPDCCFIQTWMQNSWWIENITPCAESTLTLISLEQDIVSYRIYVQKCFYLQLGFSNFLLATSLETKFNFHSLLKKYLNIKWQNITNWPVFNTSYIRK